MARFTDWIATEKTVPINSSNFQVSWAASELDSAGLIALHFVLQQQGAGTFDNSAVQLIRIKANSKTVVELSMSELIAYQEKMSPRGATDLLTDREFTVPLNMLGAENQDLADTVQFMQGATITVELLFTTGATVNGTVKLGWTRTNVQGLQYVTLVRAPFGITGQVNRQRVQFSSAGEIFTIGVVSDTKVREIGITLQSQDIFQVAGAAYNGLANQGNMLVASQKLEDGPDAASRSAAFTFLRFTHGLPAVLTNSYFEVTSNGSMTANDGYVLGSLVPMPQLAA